MMTGIIRNISALVKEKESLSLSVIRLILTIDQPLAFLPGQFIMIHCRAANGEIKKRAFSIASVPSNSQEIELCIKYVPGGIASEYLFNSVQINSTMKIDGPYGRFYYENMGTKVLFIAMGTGIAPFMSMIPVAMHDAKVTLLFGFRNPEDFLYKELLESWQSPSFTLVPCMSRPHDGWQGEKGHVQDILRRYLSGNETVYLCGSPEMVKACCKVLGEAGIDEKDIKKEQW